MGFHPILHRGKYFMGACPSPFPSKGAGLPPCLRVALDLALANLPLAACFLHGGLSPFFSEGVWGAAPCSPIALDLFPMLAHRPAQSRANCLPLLYTIIGKFESFFLFYIYGYSPHPSNSHTAFWLLRRAMPARQSGEEYPSLTHGKAGAA